jgi:hypothetical protein
MAVLRYSKWAVAAIFGGIVLTAIEVYGAVGYLVSQNQPNYLIAGGALVTVLAAILPVLAGRCWESRRYALAIMLWMAMAPALSVIIFAAIERTGSANDAAEGGRRAIALKRELAREAERDAKADVAAAEAKAAAECSRAPKPGVDPRGPQCKAAESRAEKSRERLQAARGDVAKAGIVPKDPSASRIGAVVPGLTEEAIRTFQPLVLPLVISALGLLLIAAGAHSPKPRKAPARKGKRKKRRRSVPKPSQKQASNVLPMRRRV